MPLIILNHLTSPELPKFTNCLFLSLLEYFFSCFYSSLDYLAGIWISTAYGFPSYQDMTSMIWVRLAYMLEQDIFVIFLQNQTKIRLRRSAPPKCASLKRYPKCLHDCSPILIFRKTMRCGTGHFDQRPVLIGFQAYFFVRVVSVSSRDDQHPKVQYYQYFIHTFQKHFLKAPFLKE